MISVSGTLSVKNSTKNPSMTSLRKWEWRVINNYKEVLYVIEGISIFPYRILVSFFCIVNYDCYTRSFFVIVHSLIMIPCQECPLNSVPGCHSIFSLTISSASLRKASILSRSSKHFLTLSIILSSVPCKGS
mgnify:CR=1 FL=1